MEKRPNSSGGILIVDDHRPTVLLLLDMLANAFPTQVMLTACSAEEALAMCQANAPLVVVMDIGLPGTNGIDATREIKALSSAVGVVMHSNYDLAIYRERCTAVGADAFVSKARTHGELVPAIASLLAAQADQAKAQQAER